jgi:hypothetical protein
MKYLFAAAILAGSAASYAAAPAMTVYKDPNCGCCEEWVKHINQAGFPQGDQLDGCDLGKDAAWGAGLIQFLPHRRAGN